MRVLIVGCGAVGQVLGLHLARSGTTLAFYARPASAARLRQALDGDGLPLFRISHLHRRRLSAEHLVNYRVVTDIAESQAFDPDQIWFTTPSPVYHSEWFGGFLRQVGAERVVCFAPEGPRPELIPKSVPRDRVVFGGITFIAWQGDLDGGGGRPEGVNYWLPPGLSIPLMGPAPACVKVADILKAAGLRGDVKKAGYGDIQAAVTAVMTTFVAGLELAGWSFGAFRRSPWRKCAAHGAREAVLSQLGWDGLFTQMLLGILLSATTFSLATLLLPVVFPIDAQAYLRFHFLKTRDQTLALLDLFADDGRRRGHPVSNIRAILQALANATPSD